MLYSKLFHQSYNIKTSITAITVTAIKSPEAMQDVTLTAFNISLTESCRCDPLFQWNLCILPSFIIVIWIWLVAVQYRTSVQMHLQPKSREISFPYNVLIGQLFWNFTQGTTILQYLNGCYGRKSFHEIGIKDAFWTDMTLHHPLLRIW